MSLLTELVSRIEALEAAAKRPVKPASPEPRKITRHYPRPMIPEFKKTAVEAWTQFKLTRVKSDEQISMKDLIDLAQSINPSFPAMTGDVNESFRAVILEEEGLSVRFASSSSAIGALYDDLSTSPIAGNSNV